MVLKDRLRKILDQIYSVGFSHDLENDLDAKAKLIAFLQEEDHITALDDDLNVRIAKSTLHYLIADQAHVENFNHQRACEQMTPFFNYVMQTDIKGLHYYELKLLISAIQYTKTLEETEKLAEKAKASTKLFRRVRLTENLESARANNMCYRILCEKMYHADAPSDNLNFKFDRYFDEVNRLAEDFKESEFLKMTLNISKVRQALFKGDLELAVSRCDEVRLRYGEKLGRTLENEINFYVDTFNL